MNRRLERIEIDNTNQTLVRYRFILLLISLSLIWASSVWGKESFRQPKSFELTKRAQIAKRSEWIETEVKQDENFQNQKADLVAKKRRSLSSEIEKVLNKTRKTPSEQRKSYILRLAQYYLEDYYYELGNAYRKIDKDEKAGKKTVLNTNSATAYLEKARMLYKGLLKDYVKDNQRDEILYFYALTCLNQNLSHEAISTFDTLIKDHPRSKYTPDATAQLGDYYFDAANFKKADLYFDSLVKINYKPLLPYAKYKKAWCDYKNARLQESLQGFKWVILKDAKEVQGSMHLKNEALNDIAFPYADLNDENAPLDFFKGQDPVSFRKGIEAIAAIWHDRGRYEASEHYYQELLAQDLLYTGNAKYEETIIEGYIKQNKLSKAVDRSFERLPLYSEGSPWYKANDSKPELKSILSQWEESTRKLALLAHSHYQSMKTNDSRALAIRTYESYLSAFPKAEEATTLRNNLANLQFKEAMYAKASANYIKVYKETKKDQVKEEALRNTFSCFYEQVNIDRKAQGLSVLSKKSKDKIKEEDFKETPLTDTEQKFVKLGELYLSNYGNSTDAPGILHSISYLQYTHKNFDEALSGFQKLVKQLPKHEMAITSSFLILDIQNQSKDYDGLISSCKEFLSNGPNKKDYKETVARILRQTELKKIALLEEGKKYEEAGQKYLQFSKDYGREDKGLQETALYNAAQNFYKAELYSLAVKTQEDFIGNFPKSAHVTQARLEIAKMYELFGQYSKAATLYERFALENPTHSQSPEAIRMAANLYWASNQYKKGESLLLSLEKQSPKYAQIARHDLQELYESSGNMDKTAQNIQLLIAKSNNPAETLSLKVKLADLRLKKTGRIPASLLQEAVLLGDKNRSTLKKNAAAIEAYSKAKLWSLSGLENNFRRMKFSLPQAHLERTLKNKIQMVKELESEYKKISQLGSPTWGLGALYKTSKLYLNLANDIEQAPVPTELKGNELDLYRNGIQKTFVEPFRKRAFGFATGCISQSEKLQIYSAYATHCSQVVAALDPKSNPKVRTFYLPSVQTALLIPDKNTTKTEIGSMDETELPFSSALLFKDQERTVSSVSTTLESVLYNDETSDVSESKSITPVAYSYRNLVKDQQAEVQRVLASEKRKAIGNSISFSYLNSLRLYSPRNAVVAIQEALKRDPKNAALTNLLALSFFDQENYLAAKVTWMSLNSRIPKSAVILNNLGVLALAESNEAKAIKYFSESHLAEPGNTGSINLGFLALKSHLGATGKKYFEAVIAKYPKSIPAQVGRVVAMIQKNETEGLKRELQDLTLQFKSDPYARLSVSYYLLDAMNDPEMARQVLTEYLREHAAQEVEPTFRKALEETGRMAKKELETISQDDLNTVEASLQ